MNTSKNTINRLLDVIENDIVPKTMEGVQAGCKLFGAAILRKSDLSLVVASTNTETKSPLLHGEVTAITEFYELSNRPAAKDCIFLATHEPCSLCLSAITWGGFDNFSYYFTYEDSRTEFNIPYDIDILQEVFHSKEASASSELYNRSNKYFTSTSLKELIAQSKDLGLQRRTGKIESLYKQLSDTYQKSKGQLTLP